jgi:hypothetical protein
MSETFRNERPQQERRDIHVRAIALTMASIAVTVMLAAWIASSFPKPQKPSITRESKTLSSATHYLTSDPQTDIREYQARKAKQLASYGWNGDDHQSARVPIERAMQILATQSSTQEPRQ